METGPVQPTLPSPDKAPSIERKPQPLSRNFEQRLKQLTIITENPTQQQIQKFADKIASDHPEDAEKSTEMATNSFNNLKDLVKERADAEFAVKQARKEALSASRSEFKSKLAVLREAEQKRAEITSTLRTFSNDFVDAQIELDPSQVPPTLGERIGGGINAVKDRVVVGVTATGEGVKTMGTKIGQKTQEVGNSIATGVNTVKERVSEAATYTASEVGSRIEAVKETGQQLLERGRDGLRKLYESTIGTLNQAQEVGQARFNDVKSRAEATKGRATGGISKIAEFWKNTKESISQKTSSAWEAASTWTSERRQEVATRISSISENANQMITNARNSAAERINKFNQSMQATGESVKARWDETSEAVKQFATDQAKRVEETVTKVSEKVKTEVSMAIEKGKIFLAPAWESIQKDRERIREERNIYGEKLGILVEGISDVASPIIDRIVDEGRNLRDAALGFGGKQIQGLQSFGRNVAGGVVEVGSPAWNFLAERWENLRLRANESRVRLNTFTEAVLGRASNGFTQLRESATQRAKRTSEMLTNVKLEGGRILHNGVDASREVAEWFVQNGASAKEFLLKTKEQIGQGVDMLHRYWDIYAVGKWKEAGLTDLDIKRRMKLLRATSQASLGRVASIGAAAGIEGAAMLQSLARDKRGRIALTVAALGIALAVNPELRDGLQSLLSSVDLSGIQLPDMGSNPSSIDTSAISMPDMSGASSISTPNPDINAGISSGSISPSPDVAQVITTPTPDVASPFTSSSPDIAGASTQVAPETPTVVPNTPREVAPPPTTSPDITAATPPQPSVAGEPPTPIPDSAGTITPTPDVVGSLPNLDTLIPGQPFEAQARQLAGGVNENYYNILDEGFSRFKDNFFTTAQAIVSDPTKFTPEQITIAQQQIEATTRLNSDATLIKGSQEWYDTLMKATHYWRP